MASFIKTFDFNLRRDHQKNLLWASRLWVGRRKEPILGYVPKKDEKNNSGGKGLKQAHHDSDCPTQICYSAHSPEAIDKELFSDVVPAVGVFEREVKFIVFVQHFETAAGAGARAPLRATGPVNVHPNVLAQLLQQSVALAQNNYIMKNKILNV